jgi:hypothetical protein
MKATAQIEKEKLVDVYNNVPRKFKKKLEYIFGEEFFVPKISERIKTYEDACSELGVTPIDESALLNSGFTKDEIVYRKLKTIIKALNEGWKPNWRDEKQEKWFPCFAVSSGFVFSNAYYDRSCAYAGNGLHLCFKSEELAEYAGKQFVGIYKDFIL